jgi:RNA polymerase sigma factor (sigma-70 family)
MADGRLCTAINQLRQIIGEQSGCTLTDAELLASFVEHGDQASFEVLVWRHGTMVLNLCRRILHDSHEAEDAFQATFLVFARKASAIAAGTALGSWLYKVAYRVALRISAKTARQRVHQGPLDDVPAPEATDDALWRDLRPVLDEEIERLPEKYRAPFVLCYLQGHTNEEAAKQLGCPKGTVLSRLSRGREWLRTRLLRRGVALSAGGLTTALFQNSASAAVPPALVGSTTTAGTAFAAGKTMTGVVSTSVLSLTQGVLRTMFLTKLKFAAGAALALAIVGTGTGWLTHEALAQRTPPAKAERAPGRARDAAAAPDFHGKVTAVAKDGKSFTVEMPPAARGEESKKAEVKISDKTAVVFMAVAADGAKPTEGYMAEVRLAQGAPDVAAEVTFHGAQHFRTPDVGGKVISIGKDGKSITLEAGARGRGEEGKTLEIKLTDKTLLSFSQVGKDGAKLAEGQMARIWLADNSKDTADTAHFAGSEQVEERNGPQADVVGKVASVAKDGKSATLETPPQARGEEPKKTEVKIGDKTAIVFQNVGPDGAKVGEGQMARIWLESGSKDTAAKANFAGPVREKGTSIVGRVTGVDKDGKGFTLELRPQGRMEEAKRVEIKVGDSTKVAFFGVGPNEAKPTEGFMAQVRLEEGSMTNATQVLFHKGGGERGGARRE